MNTFSIDEPTAKAWEETLQFFTDNDLVLKPVPIRRAIFDKLNPQVKVQFYDLFQKVMMLSATTPLTADTTVCNEWQDLATPFIAMAFLLPAMIIAPLEKGDTHHVMST
jgi:hypothetical protein